MPASVDPSSVAPLAAVGGPAFLGMVRAAGSIIATRGEAEVLTGTRDPEAAASVLVDGRDEVVMKLGEEGALWRGADGESVRVPSAPPPGPVVDSTGAGDAFAAAWLARRREGDEPEAALAAACAVAAEVVTRPGARPRGRAAPSIPAVPRSGPSASTPGRAPAPTRATPRPRRRWGARSATAASVSSTGAGWWA